jgi:hypothetical protein
MSRLHRELAFVLFLALLFICTAWFWPISEAIVPAKTPQKDFIYTEDANQAIDAHAIQFTQGTWSRRR